jgi:hypothetical protein
MTKGRGDRSNTNQSVTSFKDSPPNEDFDCKILCNVSQILRLFLFRIPSKTFHKGVWGRVGIGSNLAMNERGFVDIVTSFMDDPHPSMDGVVIVLIKLRGHRIVLRYYWKIEWYNMTRSFEWNTICNMSPQLVLSFTS